MCLFGTVFVSVRYGGELLAETVCYWVQPDPLQQVLSTDLYITSVTGTIFRSFHICMSAPDNASYFFLIPNSNLLIPISEFQSATF